MSRHTCIHAVALIDFMFFIFQLSWNVDSGVNLKRQHEFEIGNVFGVTTLIPSQVKKERVKNRRVWCPPKAFTQHFFGKCSHIDGRKQLIISICYVMRNFSFKWKFNIWVIHCMIGEHFTDSKHNMVNVSPVLCLLDEGSFKIVSQCQTGGSSFFTAILAANQQSRFPWPKIFQWHQVCGGFWCDLITKTVMCLFVHFK